MERREPTLSPSGLSEPSDANARRAPASTSLQDEAAPARSQRPATTPQKPVYQQAPEPSSSLPAIALVIALLGVGGAGFLGWQLFQAQAVLQQADIRIQGLEQQLNLTSEESSASVITLQANLKKLDGEVKALTATLETARKAITSSQEKITALGRDTVAAKKEATDAKSGIAGLKQEVEANKALADAASAKVDGAVTAQAQYQQQIQNLKDQLSNLQLELVDVDALTRRTKANEEAISAIDDFRRSTNSELLKIKQQMGLAPKPQP